MLFQIVCISLILLMEQPTKNEAVCCFTCDFFHCKDCTIGTPYCGYGQCNIFGCNCDGGCREGPGCGSCRKRSVVIVENETWEPRMDEMKRDSEKHLEAIFELADKNGDGKLDVDEVKFWVSKSGLNHKYRRVARSIDNEFSSMDVDHDGFLTRLEIDQ